MDSIPDAPPYTATLSRFDVPLDYDFTPILAEVERAVPKTLGSMTDRHQMGDDERRMYAYEVTRGPFTTVMKGSNVHLTSTLSYAVRGYYNPPVGPTVSGGCGGGEERPRILLELVTPLSLSADWHLQSKAMLSRMVVASDTPRDRCRVSILRFDVTDRVVSAARDALIDHLPDIDREIAKVDLTDQVSEWWGELSRPIRLTDDVWLLLEPRQIRTGPVTGSGSLLNLRVGLDAYPKVVTGAQPTPSVIPLPDLVPSAATTGFRITVDGNLDYATATREITEAVKGRTLKRGTRSVTIGSVAVSPATRGRLALTIGFDGDASGTVRFVGTPVYSATSGEISVPDLDYDLTGSRLVRMIAWVRSDALRTMLRERARVPTGPVVERGKGLLLEGLNRKIGNSVTLSATVDTVTVEGIYVTRAGVVVRAGAQGAAGVSVRE